MIIPVKNVIEIFETQAKRCINAKDVYFLLELKRLIELQDNQHIKSCLHDLQHDALKWRELIILNLNNYLTACEEFFNFITEKHSEMLKLTKIIKNTEYKAEKIKPLIDKLKDNVEDKEFYNSLTNIFDLKEQINNIIELKILKFDCKTLKEKSELTSEFGELEDEFIKFMDELTNYERIHPFAYWEEIEEVVTMVNFEHSIPSNRDGTKYRYYRSKWEFQHYDIHRNGEYGKLADTMHKIWGRNYKKWHEKMIFGIELLKDDITYRLKKRVSAEWAINKYIIRTTLYRFDEIRRLIDEDGDSSGNNQTEKLLQNDAAAYLFDLGFNVVVEKVIPKQRLDIYEELMGIDIIRDALLIETKVCKNKGEAQKVIKDGLNQLFSYATSIDSLN